MAQDVLELTAYGRHFVLRAFRGVVTGYTRTLRATKNTLRWDPAAPNKTNRNGKRQEIVDALHLKDESGTVRHFDLKDFYMACDDEALVGHRFSIISVETPGLDTIECGFVCNHAKERGVPHLDMIQKMMPGSGIGYFDSTFYPKSIMILLALGVVGYASAFLIDKYFPGANLIVNTIIAYIFIFIMGFIGILFHIHLFLKKKQFHKLYTRDKKIADFLFKY